MEDYVYMDARLIRKYLTGFPFYLIQLHLYQERRFIQSLLPIKTKKS